MESVSFCLNSRWAARKGANCDNFDPAFLVAMSIENVVLITFVGFALLFGYLVVIFFNRRKAIPARPLTWQNWAAGNALIFLFLISLFLTAGELYYRFVYDSTDAYMLSKVSKRWLHRHYQINLTDVRDSVEYAWRIRPGMRRVTFIGDSFTAGHGVKDVENRFANRIRARHPDWEVHVLAQDGWETSMELALVESVLRPDYECDIVVLVYVLNDISDLATDYWHAAIRRVTQHWQLGPFLNESYFLNTWYYRLRIVLDPDLRDYFHFIRGWYQGPLGNIQEQRLRELHDIVTRRGGRLLVVTFPFLQSTGANYPFREIHAQLNTLWTSMGVPQLDLADTLLDHPPKDLVVNRFDAHPNERAHALAADAIDDFIQSHMEKP